VVKIVVVVVVVVLVLLVVVVGVVVAPSPSTTGDGARFPPSNFWSLWWCLIVVLVEGLTSLSDPLLEGMMGGEEEDEDEDEGEEDLPAVVVVGRGAGRARAERGTMGIPSKKGLSANGIVVVVVEVVGLFWLLSVVVGGAMVDCTLRILRTTGGGEGKMGCVSRSGGKRCYDDYDYDYYYYYYYYY